MFKANKNIGAHKTQFLDTLADGSGEARLGNGCGDGRGNGYGFGGGGEELILAPNDVTDLRFQELGFHAGFASGIWESEPGAKEGDGCELGCGRFGALYLEELSNIDWYKSVYGYCESELISAHYIAVIDRFGQCQKIRAGLIESFVGSHVLCQMSLPLELTSLENVVNSEIVIAGLLVEKNVLDDAYAILISGGGMYSLIGNKKNLSGVFLGRIKIGCFDVVLPYSKISDSVVNCSVFSHVAEGDVKDQIGLDSPIIDLDAEIQSSAPVLYLNVAHQEEGCRHGVMLPGEYHDSPQISKGYRYIFGIFSDFCIDRDFKEAFDDCFIISNKLDIGCVIDIPDFDEKPAMVPAKEGADIVMRYLGCLGGKGVHSTKEGHDVVKRLPLLVRENLLLEFSDLLMRLQEMSPDDGFVLRMYVVVPPGALLD